MRTEESEIVEDKPEVSAIASLSTAEKCDLIAGLSESILEDPTKAFKQEREDVATSDQKADEDGTRAVIRQPSRIQQLLDLGRTHKNGDDEYVASLATMSLLAIFKDILPAYRIRLKTDAERAGKISRETKQLWDYERAIVTHYQQYLQLLEKSWEKGQFKGEAPSKLAMTAILSLCELLKSAFHFNFRSNILGIVVKNMNYRLSDKVSEECCKAIEYIFEKDTQGEVAMEAARMVAKLIKDYKGTIKPGLVKTFLKLPLRVHVDEAQAAKLATAANAKKRKRDRELAEIEAELKESSGEVDKILLARCQSETLQSVVLSYFRILKSPDSGARNLLLPVALEGLAKFAHLINMDTVVDLLDVLKQLLLDENLPLEATLNCVLTAFETLQGPGREMQIDVKEYITPLYAQIARLGGEGNSRSNTATALRCLNAAFIKRREYSNVRVAAFIKQLFTLAMNAPSYTSIPMMAMARQILQRYPTTNQLLESESDVITSGQYTPEVSDPEYANPFSTSGWELANLKFSANPALRDHANNASNMKLLKMPGEAPDRLWSDCHRNTKELYIEFRRISKRHPLSQKNNGRYQPRFIAPRKRQVTLVSIEDGES